ncbi:hypothetical protein GFS24_27865 [Chitinophaga sp. SYP-B3965]|uniref:DUF6169 family protein n=1 Tax=Chitinophaga sp. SYP-B3965 TaxID=2663120 RepID=UPI0012997028|nr:DUF6169 family protein [Chitinophaga sp. SYP-B3965]MRG48959.1 hypothetical protein [Chitinophaga sp. SYP-B3965]
MFIPYDLTKTEDGYQFTSDFGLTYFLYFSKYYLIDENGDDLIVTSFGFFHDPEKVRVNDQRIKATIISFIIDYFEKNPELGILYLCDPRDDLARHRRIIFGSWHREMDQGIEKFDCNKYHAKLGYYSSLLIKADNPQKQHYVDAFYRHLNELIPEEA